MKAMLSLIFIGAIISYKGQNINQNVNEQAVVSNVNFNQTNRNINVFDNNVGNMDNAVLLHINNRGVSNTNNRNNRRNQQAIQNNNPIAQQQVYNQTRNKLIQEKTIIVNEANLAAEVPQVNVVIPDININVPKINLNLSTINIARDNEIEKREPKRLDDFRIKTGGGNAGVANHRTSHNKKISFGEKVKKATRCWLSKHFSGEIKFKVSCDCFTFKS